MNWTTFRNITLFFAGLAGVAHETVVSSAERPTLLLLFAAMMGLPLFLQADENRKNGRNGNGKEK